MRMLCLVKICKLAIVLEFNVRVRSYAASFRVIHLPPSQSSSQSEILHFGDESPLLSQRATYLVVRTLGVSNSPVVKPKQGDNRKSVHQSAGSMSPRLCIKVNQRSSVTTLAVWL